MCMCEHSKIDKIDSYNSDDDNIKSNRIIIH